MTATQGAVEQAIQPRGSAGSRYLVVSGDSHAGPSLENELRAYCPQRYLEDFDEYARQVRAESLRPITGGKGNDIHSLEALARAKACAGQSDVQTRLRDMDAQGIAAEVIFAGGQNDEFIPFLGSGLGGASDWPRELQAVGCRVWNSWIADFCSNAPDRLIGTMQVPIWDVEATVREVEWAHDRGLSTLNFPAPRRDFPPYVDPAYEPLWSLVEERDIPLLTHSAGGESPLGVTGPGGSALLFLAESHWFSRRSLWELIFGFVFERHPSLRLVFTETRVLWALDYLAELDSIHEVPDFRGTRLPHYPSEYWKQNCYIAGSFMAPFEAAARHEVGLRNLMWGSDYPHAEGTWPRTELALRHTFAAVPEDELRLILGENAVEVYSLDYDTLRDIADRIGPLPEDLAKPLTDPELPQDRGLAFRTKGSFS